MAIEKVREYFRQLGREKDVLEFEISSATVELAAIAVGVEPARIAKTISIRLGEGCVLVVAAGDAKIDNAKFRAKFGTKPRMLAFEEVPVMVGHEVGGVCPFAINPGVRVFLDISLQRFETVFPACGSSNSAIKLTCPELYDYSGAEEWVDVCRVTPPRSL